MDTNDILMKVHKELMDQKVKHQRADRELKASIRSAKQKINDSYFMLIYEKYLNAKELEDRNTSALQQLADLVDNNLDMSPMVSSFLFEKGLSMPQISRTKRFGDFSFFRFFFNCYFSVGLVKLRGKVLRINLGVNIVFQWSVLLPEVNYLQCPLVWTK